MLFYAFLTEIFWAALLAWLACGVVISCLAGVSQLWAGVQPAPSGLIALTLLAVPSAQSVAVPVAALAGLVLTARRWATEGAWTGLQAIGRGGGSLWPAAALWALLAAGTTFAVGEWVEPLAKRTARQVVAASVGSAMLRPHHQVQVGSLQVRVGPRHGPWYHQVVVSLGEQVGTARRGRTVRTAGGASLVLEQGLVTGPGQVPWTLRFERALVPVVPVLPRTGLGERRLPQLLAIARRTEAAGGQAAYEWSVAYKRLLHPVGVFIACLAGLPIGFRRPLAAVVLGVGYLAAVRFGDGLAVTVGPWAAASTGPLVAGGGLVLAYWGWRER